MAVRDIFDRPAKLRRLVICTGPCCDRLGKASANLDVLRQLLTERMAGEDRVERGSCVRKACLGKCSGEPLAHVVPDDIWYQDLSPENLLRVYDEHVLGGSPVSELVLVEEEI